MSHRIRFLLFCLIALALPLQGIAAATLLNCDHARPAPMDAMVHGHAHHHGGQVASHDKAGCSACAACCLGVAIAPTALQVRLPIALATIRHAEPDAVWADLTPALLERPPRYLLA